MRQNWHSAWARKSTTTDNMYNVRYAAMVACLNHMDWYWLFREPDQYSFPHVCCVCRCHVGEKSKRESGVGWAVGGRGSPNPLQ